MSEARASVSLAEIFEERPDEAAETVLEVRGVTVKFSGIVALDEVSFDARKHELVALIGPNGSGKSTMLNSISGLVRANASGEIAINGKSMLGSSPYSVARARVGRSFQNPSLIDTATVVENVMLGEHLRLRYSMADEVLRRRRVRRNERQARRRAETVLEFMDIAGLVNSPVGGLAYGTRKLIDIARAIVSGPDLLLLDEPTSGLDSDEQAAVGQMLRELHGTTSITILVVEHHMHVVREIADKVVALESGRVLTVGNPEEVLASESFREISATPEAHVLEDVPTTVSSSSVPRTEEGDRR
jgi:branched-chain amino acid transport system ATP-binding protein